ASDDADIDGERVPLTEPNNNPLNQESDTFASNTMPDDDMTGRERDQADAEQSEMAAAATAGTSGQPTTLVGRVQERVENILSPIGQWTRPPGIRFILGLGGLLVLIALLANN